MEYYNGEEVKLNDEVKYVHLIKGNFLPLKALVKQLVPLKCHVWIEWFRDFPHTKEDGFYPPYNFNLVKRANMVVQPTIQVCQYACAQVIPDIEPRELVMYNINRRGMVLPKYEHGIEEEVDRLKNQFMREVLRTVREVPFCTYANEPVECYIYLDGPINVNPTHPIHMVPKFYCSFCHDKS